MQFHIPKYSVFQNVFQGKGNTSYSSTFRPNTNVDGIQVKTIFCIFWNIFVEKHRNFGSNVILLVTFCLKMFSLDCLTTQKRI